MKLTLLCFLILSLSACSLSNGPEHRLVANKITNAEFERWIDSDEAKRIGLKCRMERYVGTMVKRRVCSTNATRKMADRAAVDFIQKYRAGQNVRF